ncbi:MAG: SDR family oxidoreductase [Nitrospirae bacterium]|nr:SDR family oxidoreductase [Nitrospirota bacterium]
MPWRFKDRIVVVTGASSGIGKATALAFARQGAKLGLIARDQTALEDVAKTVRDSGQTAVVAPADVTKPKELQQAIQTLVRQFKTVDVLVNNAGYGVYGYFLEVPIEEQRALFETNFFGALHAILAVIPLMKAKKSGIIINVSSMAGLRPIPKFAAYSASKAALNSISEALRLELKPYGIHVMLVCPGTTATQFQKRARHFGKKAEPRHPPKAFVQTAEEVADLIVEGAASGKRVIVPGLLNWVGLQVDRLAPRNLSDRLIGRFLDLGPDS